MIKIILKLALHLILTPLHAQVNTAIINRYELDGNVVKNISVPQFEIEKQQVENEMGFRCFCQSPLSCSGLKRMNFEVPKEIQSKNLKIEPRTSNSINEGTLTIDSNYKLIKKITIGYPKNPSTNMCSYPIRSCKFLQKSKDYSFDIFRMQSGMVLKDAELQRTQHDKPAQRLSLKKVARSEDVEQTSKSKAIAEDSSKHVIIATKCFGNNTAEHLNTEKSKVTFNWNYYPNPIKGKLNFQCNVDISKVIVSDLSGKIIKTLHNYQSNSQELIDLRDEASGTYLIHFAHLNKTYSGKVILIKE